MIEHQSKVDYRMPFRILKHEMAIIESAIDEKEYGKKKLFTSKSKRNSIIYGKAKNGM